MNRQKVIPMVMFAALLLQSCGGLLTSEQAAKQYYLLVPYEAAPTAAVAGPAPQLGVFVTAVPGLDTDRILALGADARLNRYSNARWPDHLPEVLTSVLRRSLETSGGFDTLESPASVSGGWSLQLEVRKFYGEQDAASETRSVTVELAGTLVCAERSAPVHLEASRAVSEQRLSAVVAAHQAGLDSVTRDLLNQLGRECGG